MASKKTGSAKFIYFLLGAASGSLATFLFATHGGRVFRRILMNDTNLLWDDVKDKSKDLYSSIDAGIRHSYKRALRTIDTELRSVKAGINAAIVSVKKEGVPYSFAEDITEDYILEDNDFGFNFENLPTREGMKRRRDHNRFS